MAKSRDIQVGDVHLSGHVINLSPSLRTGIDLTANPLDKGLDRPAFGLAKAQRRPVQTPAARTWWSPLADLRDRLDRPVHQDRSAHRAPPAQSARHRVHHREPLGDPHPGVVV